MSNRYKWTLEKVKKRLKDGYGRGFGADYKPFLTVMDVPSSTTVSRLLSMKTQRTHHYFSFLEVSFHYILEHSQKVMDIREQFPLPLEETLEIAQQQGIAHPGLYRKFDVAFVMTTDFFIDCFDGGRTTVIARAIKPSNYKHNKRVCEKLKLEQIYWNNRGIDWGVITEDNIPSALVKNLEWIHSSGLYWNFNNLTKSDILTVKDYLNRYIIEQCPISTAGKEIDTRLKLIPGSTMTVFRFLLANHVYKADLFTLFDLNQPMNVTQTNISIESVVNNYERDFGQYHNLLAQRQKRSV